MHVGLGVNVGSISRNFMQGALTNTGNQARAYTIKVMSETGNTIGTTG